VCSTCAKEGKGDVREIFEDMRHDLAKLRKQKAAWKKQRAEMEATVAALEEQTAQWKKKEKRLETLEEVVMEHTSSPVLEIIKD
jgi:chromosome segregation ATPase